MANPPKAPNGKVYGTERCGDNRRNDNINKARSVHEKFQAVRQRVDKLGQTLDKFINIQPPLANVAQMRQHRSQINNVKTRVNNHEDAVAKLERDTYGSWAGFACLWTDHPAHNGFWEQVNKLVEKAEGEIGDIGRKAGAELERASNEKAKRDATPKPPPAPVRPKLRAEDLPPLIAPQESPKKTYMIMGVGLVVALICITLLVR